VSQSVSDGSNGVEGEPLAGDDLGPMARGDEQHHESAPRWRPGVRLVLALIVLLPTIALSILTTSGASSSWSTRQDAGVVAGDALRLEGLARALTELNDARIPAMAVSYAASVGIGEAELSSLLGRNIETTVSTGAATVNDDPTFTSTPTLRSDKAAFATVVHEVQTGSISFDAADAETAMFASDIDQAWNQAFARMQRDLAGWHPPGSFEVQVAALRQAFTAFINGGYQVQAATYVLEGRGDETSAQAEQQLLQSTGAFTSATTQFAGQLGPKAQAAWALLQSNPASQAFMKDINQAVTVGLNNEPPPFATDLAFAGTAMTDGLVYLDSLGTLVEAASADLRDAALADASTASAQFFGEIAFLALLILISIGGVLIAGRWLTGPLKKLSEAATRVRTGEFEIERLPESGPREVAATTTAFNDMTSTLEAVESKVVALALEDLSHPELQKPLPGRTGKALQATVDHLLASIREREVQRQQLHEAATHDRLTGLLNRAAVLDFLAHDVARRRDAGETVAVLFVDLDGLKPLNDHYGHTVGDAAIETTAHALLEATGPCDVVGRLGGDEFLVVLCATHSHGGAATAERIRNTVAQHSVETGQMAVALQCSVGIALAECDADTDPVELVRTADEAMYEGKKAARARRASRERSRS
jgi:diguanylate cyclase (GGDEF)-like protein